MDKLHILSQKIEVLKENLLQISEMNMNEKLQLQAQIVIIEECEKVISDEKLMSNFDFSNVINLLETFNYSIENLSQIITDIQNVIMVREELNLSKEDMPLEDIQSLTFQTFMEKLKIIKDELNERLNKLTKNQDDDKKISNLEELKNILEGNSRKKYYTEEMFRDFYESFDILNLPLDEAKSLLENFYDTENLSSRRNKEKANFTDVIALYEEFLPSHYMTIFKQMLEDYENEIVSVIDLDNTREILKFFKEKGILDNFMRTALLKVTLYGNAGYIKEVVYPKICSLEPKVVEAFYKDDLATTWVKESGTGLYKSSHFRRYRSKNGVKDVDSLYSTCHTVDYDEFWENIELLKKNSDLFQDDFDIFDVGANLNIKTMPVWILRKNIQLCRLFQFGVIAPIPETGIGKVDIEDKIHLAVELGLLNPPLTPVFLEMDKDIIRNDEFQRNCSKKKLSNQTIRNYFQRYLTILAARSINEYAYLFYRLQEEGYLNFYNDFFSDFFAGKGNPYLIDKEAKKLISDKQKMDSFITDNFMIDWYSAMIENYDEYDNDIMEYNEEQKKKNYKDLSYFDEEILDNPLIKELEENNTVMDILNINNEVREVKNQFVYMFDNRIISRYKVLHNASILKNVYGTFTRDMLMTCIVRNSFLDENTFNTIYNDVMKRGKKL